MREIKKTPDEAQKPEVRQIHDPSEVRIESKVQHICSGHRADQKCARHVSPVFSEPLSKSLPYRQGEYCIIFFLNYLHCHLRNGLCHAFLQVEAVYGFFPIVRLKDQLVECHDTGNTDHEPIHGHQEYIFNKAVLFTLYTTDHVVIEKQEIAKHQ